MCVMHACTCVSGIIYLSVLGYLCVCASGIGYLCVCASGIMFMSLLVYLPNAFLQCIPSVYVYVYVVRVCFWGVCVCLLAKRSVMACMHMCTYECVYISFRYITYMHTYVCMYVCMSCDIHMPRFVRTYAYK